MQFWKLLAAARIACGLISGCPDPPASPLQPRLAGRVPVTSPRTSTARSSWSCARTGAAVTAQATTAAISAAPRTPPAGLANWIPRLPMCPRPSPALSAAPSPLLRAAIVSGRLTEPAPMPIGSEFLAKAGRHVNGPQANPPGPAAASSPGCPVSALIRHFVSLKSPGILPTKQRLPFATTPLFQESLGHVPDSQGDISGCRSRYPVPAGHQGG